MNKTDRLLGIAFGVFILAGWATTVILLLSKPLPDLLFGGISIAAILLISRGASMNSDSLELVLYMSGAAMLGVVAAFSWLVYDFGIVPSVVVASVGTYILVLGLRATTRPY